MFDRDLAELYGVETRRLNEQVKRNINRFPEDFMFELSQEEFKDLRSQFATSSLRGAKESENLRSHFGTSSWGGRRYLPYVFTEQGVAMPAWRQTGFPVFCAANVQYKLISPLCVRLRNFGVNGFSCGIKTKNRGDGEQI